MFEQFLAAAAAGWSCWLFVNPSIVARLDRHQSVTKRHWVAKIIELGKIDIDAERREREAIIAALPKVCELLAVCVQAGLPLRAAVVAVSDVATGSLATWLQQLCLQVELGVSEQAAWAELAKVPGLEHFGAEISRCVESGAAVTQLLSELASQTRKAAASQAEVRAKRVGVRSVLPLMMCFLPAFVLLGIVPVIGGVIENLIH